MKRLKLGKKSAVLVVSIVFLFLALLLAHSARGEELPGRFTPEECKTVFTGTTPTLVPAPMRQVAGTLEQSWTTTCVRKGSTVAPPLLPTPCKGQWGAEVERKGFYSFNSWHYDSFAGRWVRTWVYEPQPYGDCR